MLFYLVCRIIAAKTSTASFLLLRFSFDCSRQAATSFFHTTIFAVRQSNLDSSTRSWYSSKDFCPIFKLARYNRPSSNSGPGAITGALINSTFCCHRNEGPRSWSATAKKRFNRLVWAASISATSFWILGYVAQTVASLSR